MCWFGNDDGRKGEREGEWDLLSDELNKTGDAKDLEQFLKKDAFGNLIIISNFPNFKLWKIVEEIEF